MIRAHGPIQPHINIAMQVKKLLEDVKHLCHLRENDYL